MRKLIPSALLVLAACASPSEPSKQSAPIAAATAAQPDIVVVITDDQRYDQMGYMPQTTALLQAEAVQFDQAYTTTPQCCPSRSTFLSGLYSHNTGVLTSGSPNGGAIKFKPGSTIATWLKGAGYRTILVGKYLNGFKPQKVGPAVPPGWTQFVAFWCSDDDAYYCQLDSNGVIKTPPAGTYSTTQTASIATNYIRTAASTTPLFLMWTPFGPHSSIQNTRVAPPKPEFASDLSPFLGDLPFRPTGFDSLPIPTPAWLTGRPPFTQAVKDSIDDFRRNAQAALQSVDRGVAQIIAALQAAGRWQNTLFVIWSDNGLSYGEHRIHDTKFCPYEECQRVAMWIRVPAGIARHDSTVVANLDLAPTIAAWAGVTPASVVDGLNLMPLVLGGALARSCLLLEQLGSSLPATTFQAMRCNQWKYIEYANGDAELYDLSADPSELDNHAADPAYASTTSAMAAQLAQYKSVGVSITAGTGSGSGTVSGPLGINCTISNGATTGSCSNPLITGSVIAFTATPSGYGTFLGWGGACTGTAPTCTVTFSSSKMVTAAFAPPPPVTLSLQSGLAAGDGTVTGPSGLNCTISGGKTSGSCSVQLPQGSTVTLDAAPSGHGSFMGWGGACSGTGASCTITLTATQLVSAGFNNPPVASFIDTCTDLACSFDGSGSTDDIAVVTWDWSFGDSATATGVSASHSYAGAGSYPVTLTVTDSSGLTSTQTTTVTVTPRVNQAPVAFFTDRCTLLDCTFDGAGSTDDAGIATYDWTFGDGASATGVSVSHAYAADGDYPVTLTVTDAEGLSNTLTKTITVSVTPPPNQPPVAAFTESCTLLACSFDGAASTDDIGIASYDWDFGDGSTAVGVTATHSYAAGGSYTVTLTVTDGGGLSGTLSSTVTVTAPVNQPPVAGFTTSCTLLACGFDGTGSTDDAGIVSYAWNFGDGSSATGATASHSYAVAGSYLVTLTVTDAGGLTSSQTSTVAVTAPVNKAPVARFTYSCTAARLCTLDGSTSTDDVAVVLYTWTFGATGAGGTATGVTTTRSYSKAGSFVVNLIVTDGGGLTSKISKTIVVP